MDAAQTQTTADAPPPLDARARPAHRTAILAGAAAGLALVVIVAAWLAWRTLSAPTRPSLETASVAEVFDYMIDPRGFDGLARFDQDRFFDDLKRHFREDAPHRALKKHLDECSEERLTAIRERFEPVVLRQVIGAARQYQSLGADRRFAFLAEFHAKADADARWLRGDGDAAKDLRSHFHAGVPNSPEALEKLVTAKIKPDDLRAIQAFVADLKRWEAQQKSRRAK